MNARAAAASATAATIPGAVIIGTALIVSSYAGLRAQRDHYRAEASRPRPTVTETAPAPATTASATATLTPSPQPVVRSVRAAEGTIVVPAGNSAPGAEPSESGARSPAWPTPTPTATPAACRGTVLAVQLRAACITVGGSQ